MISSPMGSWNQLTHTHVNRVLRIFTLLGFFFIIVYVFLVSSVASTSNDELSAWVVQVFSEILIIDLLLLMRLFFSVYVHQVT